MKNGIICTVFDSQVKVYSQPMTMQNKGAALRAWQEASNDKNQNIGKYPADHTLFAIGEWDENTGEIKIYESKQSLGLALDFVNKEQQ